MFQHSFTFLVLAACLKFMPVCVDLLFDFRFGSVRFIFLPGRCVRKRTIGHQLVNEEGKVDGEPPPLPLLPPPPTSSPNSILSVSACFQQFHLLQTRRDSGQLQPPL